MVLITGDEPLLVDRAVHRTTAAARRIDPEVERREAPAAGLSPGEFADLVAPSLFAEPRVVVVRGAQVRTAVDAGDKATAQAELVTASRSLDKAVSKGVIHANQAANRKSALAHQVNAL